MEWLHRHCGVHPKGTNPFKGDGSPTKLLKMALLFTEGKTVKRRKDILIKVGLDKELACKKGYNSSLFDTLSRNCVIVYDKENRTYKAGRRYKEYLKHCVERMTAKGYQTKSKKIYSAMLKESSQSMHFILD